MVNWKVCRIRLRWASQLFMCLSLSMHTSEWRSVSMQKSRPSRYTRKALTPSLIAKDSFSMVEYIYSRGSKFLLQYATRYSWPSSPCWFRTAPTPCSDASVWSTNEFSKSRLISMGAEQSNSLSVVNACSHASVHTLAWEFHYQQYDTFESLKLTLPGLRSQSYLAVAPEPFGCGSSVPHNSLILSGHLNT